MFCVALMSFNAFAGDKANKTKDKDHDELNQPDHGANVRPGGSGTLIDHGGQVMTNALSWVPNWAGALIFLVLLGGLAWYALRQIGVGADGSREPPESTETNETVETEESPVIEEEPVEY